MLMQVVRAELGIAGDIWRECNLLIRFRKKTNSLLNAAGGWGGQRWRPRGIIIRSAPGIHALAASELILKKGRASSPLAIATGILICPNWRQLMTGEEGSINFSVRELSSHTARTEAGNESNATAAS